MLTLKIPKDIGFEWGKDFVRVQGPLGTLIKRKGNFNLAIKNAIIYIWGKKANLNESIFLSLIHVLLQGVCKGFNQKLKLVGVGFKAVLLNNTLILKLGYSHEVIYKIPTDIIIKISKNKGVFLLIKGYENAQVQQVAQEIRLLRLPDSYKGKGVQYKKEILKLKKGKRENK